MKNLEYSRRPKDLDLGNWRTVPWSSWAFTHVGDLIPSATIYSNANATECVDRSSMSPLPSVFELAQGEMQLGDYVKRTSCAALVRLKADGQFDEWYSETYDLRRPHILFSVSKSLTGCLAMTLASEGRLDYAAPVTRYVPEAGNSAFATASVQNVLDMDVSIDIDESYLDPNSAYGTYRRATLWNPPSLDQPEIDMLSFLCTIQSVKGRDHGTQFYYCSPNTDMLGIICERAAGIPFTEALDSSILQPSGVQHSVSITVDRKGAARAAGGMSLHPRDLARVGRYVCSKGKGADSGRSDGLFAPLWTGGNAENWRIGHPQGTKLGVNYHNQWYHRGDADHCIFGVGIHGQFLFINPRTQTVVVQFSATPLPVDEDTESICLQAFEFLSH